MKQDFACHASARQLLEMCFCPTTPGAQHTSEHTRNRAQQSSVLELEPTSILSSANLSPPLTWNPMVGCATSASLARRLSMAFCTHGWYFHACTHHAYGHADCWQATETFKILSGTSSVT